MVRDELAGNSGRPGCPHRAAGDEGCGEFGHVRGHDCRGGIRCLQRGYKPIPGDGGPVFGELEKVPRCFVDFTHSGATLGLIAGELLAGEILTGHKHPMLETFRPERFS